MPTLPAFASESAFAMSASLLCAASFTSPPVAVTLAAAPTSASVWCVTMFSASAPAMLSVSLSPPAPDVASALTSCSARMKKSPLDGLAGKLVPVETAPRVVTGLPHVEPSHL